MDMKKRKEIRKNTVRWGRPMAVTLILILLIIGGSFFATERINRREEENAFTRLYEETGALAVEVEEKMGSDREQLETVASVLSEYDDLSSPRVRRILRSYSSVGMMSRLELLLPDDTVIRQDGTRVDAQPLLSFEKEAALGAHITNRETGLSGEAGYVLRHYVPVIRNGETAAMLYGVIELGSLPESFPSPYGGKAAIYIIDGTTGDFLVDTWHDEPGNIWDLGERPMAPGYDHGSLKQGLIDGQTGYVVFVSETIGDYLYFYYEPLAINDWRIALSVPADDVFADANAVRHILDIFLTFETVCFILYFLWMLRYVRHETAEKQKQLDTINYIYDVENLLFNAHEQRDNISLALEKIARITSAEAVSFLPAASAEETASFIWEKKNGRRNGPTSSDIREVTLLLKEYFLKGQGQFSVCDASSLRAAFPNLKAGAVKNLTSIPIQDTDGSLLGILTAFHASGSQENAGLLKNVAFSFGMLCHNMRSYNAIREKGEKDVLSGLYNRNRYERDLPGYPSLFQKSLACIYVDANGLHELNNSQGHEAGDRMLKAVSGQLLDRFGRQHTYRIGGDEFLAFAPDMEEEDVTVRVREMEAALERQNFHISVGVQWAEDVPSMDTLVKAAEQRMYLAKKAFYENETHDRRKGARR